MIQVFPISLKGVPKYLFCVFFLVTYLGSNAQERSFTISGKYCVNLHTLKVDSNYNNFNLGGAKYQLTVMSDKNGDLLFYNKRNVIYSKFNRMITNGTLQLNGDSIYMLASIKFDDSSYAIIAGTFDTTISSKNINRYIRKFLIHYDEINDSLWIYKEDTIIKSRVYGFGIKKSIVNNWHWLIANENLEDSVELFAITKNSIIKKDKISVKPYRYGRINSYYFKFSNQNRFITFEVHHPTLDTFQNAVLFFSDTSGKFSNLIVKNNVNQAGLYCFPSYTFSANDSFYYYPYGNHGGNIYFKCFSFLNDATVDSFHTPNNEAFYTFVRLHEDGYVYYSYIKFDNVTSQYKYHYLARVLMPTSSCVKIQIIDSFYFDIYAYPGIGYFNSWAAFPNDYPEIKRVRFSFEQNCNSFNFYNRSDTGIYKSFTWYFSPTDSIVQTVPHVNMWGTIPAAQHAYSTKGIYKIRLKATKDNGYSIFWEDSIYYRPLKPTAKFFSTNSQGCQYVAYTFIDSCITDTVSNSGYSWHYYFGDGMDTLITSNKLISNLSVNHIFTSSGIFNVRLVFSNGFCSDTFDYSNIVNILPAPKPGFTLTPSSWCGVPVTINLNSNTTSNVVRYFFDLGNGDTISSTSLSLNYTYNLPGTYKIHQRILGSTGCITEDSLLITIKKGLSKNDTVKVLYTTVIDSVTTLTIWEALPLATKYILNATKSTSDTFYLDKNANPNTQSKKYIIGALDSCGNSTASAPIAQTIYLSAQNHNFNEYAILSYTPYETWQNGVLEYRIEYFNPVKNEWLSLTTTSPSTLAYKTEVLPSSNGILNSAPDICYRVIATERNGNKQISTSNETCIDIFPVVFIPTAFSPNNDGINDYYKPMCAGLSTYIFEIYDRWGQLIYTDTPVSKGWDGTFKGEPLKPDIYVFRMSANSFLNSSVTNGARNIEKKGTLMLIR